MHFMRFCAVLILLVGGSVELARGASLDLPEKRYSSNGEPCRVARATNNVQPDASIRVSRRSAIYIIQHIHKACQILVDLRDYSSQVDAIRSELYRDVIRPIYRGHPRIMGVSARSSPKPSHATSRDIPKADAVQVDDKLTRLQNDLMKLGNKKIGEAADEGAGKESQKHFLDAIAELSFAAMIGYDAYPDLFASRMNAVPEVPRTAESDVAFRNGAPPLGVVKLSDAAFALVQNFMRDVRKATDEDHIAAIGWVRQQASKAPGDTAWSDKGPGWILGAYKKSQVPPDVIDTVRGIKIVITADDPAALAGKTIDATNHLLFVRD